MQLLAFLAMCFFSGVGMTFVALSFAGFMYFKNQSAFRFLGLAFACAILAWGCAIAFVNL